MKIDTSFHVREHVGPADRPRVFSLLNNGGIFLPREMSYGMDLFDGHLMHGDASQSHFMLYEAGRDILAYGCYGQLRLTDKRYHLHWMAVDTTCQKQGMGRQLEAAIVDKVRQLGGVKIYTQLSNRDYHASGRGFYEKCGYRITATVSDYYGDSDDQILYVKDINAGLS